MDYKPGLITASIFGGQKKSSNSLINDLFSKKTEPTVKAKKPVNEKEQKKLKKQEKDEGIGDTLKEIANTTIKNGKKAGSKRKLEDQTASATKSKKVKKNSLVSDEAQSSKKSNKTKKDSSVSGSTKASQNPGKFPFIHESLLKKSQEQKPKKEKKRLKKDDDDDEPQDLPPTRRKRDKTADKRTVFVGNCPLSADKKVIRSLFKDYGSIESIRFRCGPTAKLELPKRAVIIKKEFHEKASSYVCFVVYKEEESAAKALGKNGHFLDGHHLRVDLASNQNQHDKRKSIFVGNLPFTVTEEDLRSHFEDCGEIINVRVIRDRQTSLGKGIAYIQFDSRDGVVLAQKLNDLEFQERKLRVMRCSSKAKLKKTEDNPRTTKTNPRMMKNKTMSKPTGFQGKAKDFYSRSDPRPEKRKTNFAPTNSKTTKSFRDIFEARKERRVNKMKKKKQSSQKPDGLASIFGDISADMKKLKADNPKLAGKKVKKPKDKKKEKKAKKKLKKAT